MTRDLRVGLDSNCLSYLIRVASDGHAASALLFVEAVALVRLWFYALGRFYVTATVARECSQIPVAGMNSLHQSFTSHTYWGVPLRDRQLVNKRVTALRSMHDGEGDCAVLAEAEDANFDVLLTCDKKLLRRKNFFHSTVALRRPTEFWDQLKVPRGIRPVVRPAPGNPLEAQVWWQW